MVKLKIDNFEVEVEAGTSILDAARSVQIDIPTLCKHPDVDPSAGCGMCIVKVNGRIMRSCCTPVAEGMEVVTSDAELRETRKTVLELILSNHPNHCLTCIRSGQCELQDMAMQMGVDRDEIKKILSSEPIDDSTQAIVLEPDKCIVCGRCVDICQNQQNVWALSYLNRGLVTKITGANDARLNDTPCIKCGQCAAHCPTGAISEYDDTAKVWDMLKDEELVTVVQIAPAVRVALGEEFGYDFGANLTCKIYAALRRLGFSKVFDTNFGADLTIIEEASEFVKRFTNNETLPMFTSCCPAWVDYIEKNYPERLPHLSSCKSPHQMVGALAKTYYAQKMGIDASKIRVVSIMPCTAKKWEIRRHETMSSSGYQDVDVVLTTRELAKMIRQGGINFKGLKDEQADSLLGEYSGAATIFGVTGGVMTAALRTAYFYITGQELGMLNFAAIEGLDSIKVAEVDINGTKIRIAVVNGVGNAEQVMKNIRAAEEAGEEMPYHFIEVMACRGGCISGGGQPKVMQHNLPKPWGINDEIRKLRSKGLNCEDEQAQNRLSHHNEEVKKLYADFLGKAGEHKAHELLHTKYRQRDQYK